MDAKVTEYFADVIALAQATFEGVKYVNDVTPLRAILRLEAKYRIYRVLITELFSDEVRKYRYYVLEGDRVEAGFDNSPDPVLFGSSMAGLGQNMQVKIFLTCI